MNRTTQHAPSYRIYAVERRHTTRARWMDIGSAFTHSDGKGFDLELHTMPLNAAELVVRPSAEKRLADGSFVQRARQNQCSSNAISKSDGLVAASP